jgi:hypothetical protein
VRDVNGTHQPEEVHMSFHHRRRRRIRRAALALACCALAAPSAAFAAPTDSGPLVTPAAKLGDTPADFPGAIRAPQYEAPRTISIVRPERTVVRDVDEALPIALSTAALLLALGGLGIALARTGVVQRGLANRTH